MDKFLLLMAIIGIGLIVFSQTVSMLQAQQNTTNANETTETLPTGQESVPVTATNGTTQQVAPAESVTSLLNFITATLIPSIIGLIMAAIALIKLLPLSKKQNAAIRKAENGLIYVDTLAPKISDQFFRSGATTTAIELIANEIDRVNPGFKDMVMKRLEPAKYYEDQLRETNAQIETLRRRLEQRDLADNQKEIPRLSDGNV